jgi:hypothetical protein
MCTATQIAEFNRDQTSLSDEERLHFLDEFLVATSSGWAQVMSVLESYVWDPETRETLEELMAPDGLVIRDTERDTGALRRRDMVENMMKLHKCENCSIRCRGAAKPGSVSARIHRWHKTWWPGWKIYQAELRARTA